MQLPDTKSKKQKPLSGTKHVSKTTIIPASPTVLKRLNIPLEIRANFKHARDKLLHRKEENIIHDKRLRPYQNNDVNFLIQLKHGKGLFSEQRTGKTPTTLVAMRVLGETRNLIFTTKSNIIAWVQEYRKWHSGPVMTPLSSWTKERRDKAYRESTGTIVVNYAKAHFDYDILFEIFRGCGQAIVIDEAHYLRNYTNALSKTSLRTGKLKHNSAKSVIGMIRLRKLFTDPYALTGTPTANGEEDIFGILTFLFPEIFSAYYTMMHYYFLITEDTWGKKQLHGYKPGKETEMQEFLETIATQRKRIDIMTWLPKTDFEIIYLDPTEKQRKGFDELTRFYETHNIICENEISVMMALRQLTIYPKHFKWNEIGPKVEYIRDLMKDYPKKPIIILSYFSTILNEIVHDLKLNDSNYRILTGKSSAKDSYTYQTDYNDKKFYILFANIDVFNVGLKYNRAEQIIFLDESLIHVYNQQAYDRFIPTNKQEALEKKDQKITLLLMKKSIDIYIHDMLMDKKNKTDIVNNFIQNLKENRE